MDFSLLKRVVTSHVRGSGAGLRPGRPLQPGFWRAVGCDVCSEQIAANAGGKRGREEALEEPWPSGTPEVDFKSPIFTSARPMCSEFGA